MNDFRCGDGMKWEIFWISRGIIAEHQDAPISCATSFKWAYNVHGNVSEGSRDHKERVQVCFTPLGNNKKKFCSHRSPSTEVLEAGYISNLFLGLLGPPCNTLLSKFGNGCRPEYKVTGHDTWRVADELQFQNFWWFVTDHLTPALFV